MATSEYMPLIQAAAQKYGVPVNVLASMAQHESSFNPNAVSPQGAQGLLQIMPANDKALGLQNPFDPAQNIDAGAKLLAQNLHATGGNIQNAVAMYHGGTDTANWGPKTHAYVKNVMNTASQVQPVSKPAPGQMTVADMDKMYGGSQSAPTSGTPAASSSAPMTVADMDKMYGSPAQSTSSAPAPAHGPFVTGILQGVHDVIDKPAEWLAGAADKIGLGSLGPTQAQTVASDSASRADFNQTYGDTFAGNAGRVGGQILASAPVLAAGGALIGGGSKLAGAAIGDNVVGRGIAGAGNLLTGTAGAGISGAPGLAARTVSRAAGGALIGAGAAGLTSGAYDAPLSKQLEQGALYGSVGGVAAPVIGSAVKAGGRFVKNLVAPAIDRLAPQTVTNSAANQLIAAGLKDGMTPEQIVQNMRNMGPLATLADTGGANVKSIGEAIANTPGRGKQLAQQVLEGRMDTQPSRINEAIKAATGATGQVYDDAAALAAQRSAQAAPLYDKALSATITPDTRLAQFLQDPVVQKGIAQGAEISRLDALAKGQPFNAANYLTPGEANVPQSVSMTALDSAKKGLDDLVEQYRDPVSGKLNLDQRGKALNDVRTAFVNHLDQINPDYAAARAAWAGPSQSLDAMNMGQRALKNDPEVTAKIVGNLSDGDKQFFLSGVTRALQDKINSAADGASAVRRIFGNSLMRSKIQAAFDDPKAFSQFENQMNAEAQFAQTRNDMISGSQTARRLAAQGQQGADFSLPIAHALNGNLGTAAKTAVSGIGQWAMQPSEQRMAAQANLLFGSNSDEVMSAFNKAKPGPLKQALSNMLTGAGQMSPAAASLGYQANQGR